MDFADAPSVALRIEPTRGILPPYDLPSEARLLRRLARRGVPVPEVLAVSSSLNMPDHADRGCLALEWIHGSVMLGGRVEASVARAYCQTLKQIHTLDWQAAGIDWLSLPPASGPAMRERAEIDVRLLAFGMENQPHIRRLRCALEGRVPSETPPMLVHGDVNFGNFIVQSGDAEGQPARVAAVLDWEQAHLGDPLCDWGRLGAEDLLGNLDLTDEARHIMRETLASYGRSHDDLHYWTLHQLYKHSSATAALSVLLDWNIEAVAAMYAVPTERLLYGSVLPESWP